MEGPRLVSVGVFMVSLDLFIVNIAFPEIQGDFAGSSVSSISWVLNAYAIVSRRCSSRPAGWPTASGAGAPSSGGSRSSYSALRCARSRRPSARSSARASSRRPARPPAPTSLALLLPEFRPSDRPQAIGIWAAVGGLAAAAGPPIGGLLVELELALVFLVNVPIGHRGHRYGRARPAREPRATHDAPRPARSALIFAARRPPRAGPRQGARNGAGRSRACSAPSRRGGRPGGLWRRCPAHPSPVIDPATAARRSFAVATARRASSPAGFAAMLLAGVLFMTEVWHVSVLHAGSAGPGPLAATP